MDSDTATLIGLLLSDGSVYFDKSKRTFCVQLTSKSESLRECFKTLMKSCFGAKSFYEPDCKNGVSVRVFSKRIASRLFEMSPTFRKLPCNSKPRCNIHSCIKCSPVSDKNGVEWPPCIIPEDILRNTSLASAFVRGYASGDGSVYWNERHAVRQIEIACFHPTLKRQIASCIALLGIRCRTLDKGVVISSKSELLKFSSMVGFLPESTVCDSRSRWLGAPKNSVLRLALH